MKNKTTGEIRILGGGSSENVNERYKRCFSSEWDKLPLVDDKGNLIPLGK